MNIELEEKLAQLRIKWRKTKDPMMKGLIEKQAKLLKLGQAKSEDLYEKAKKIFGGKDTLSPKEFHKKYPDE